MSVGANLDWAPVEKQRAGKGPRTKRQAKRQRDKIEAIPPHLR